MKRRAFVKSGFAAMAAAAVPLERAIPFPYRLVSQVPPDVEAITGDGREVTLRGRDIQELAAALRGRLLLSGYDGYDEARQILNPSFDRYPALIAQPTGTADVQNAVRFAAEHELLVAVKCGGHSFSGQSTCDRGMMIDLSPFRGVRVDPTARRARAAGGTLLGEVDHEAMAHGLVTSLGTVSHTGVGGLTTGGGFGRVARRFGLALDNVTSVDVVAADGRLHHASDEENQDLYWGVRGGGGNFGIVTSFEYRLHPMQRQVVGGVLLFPMDRMREVLRLYADYAPEAPDELYLDCLILREPGEAPGVAGFDLCWSGPENEAERALAPLRRLGAPALDAVTAVDYVTLQRSADVTDPRAVGQYLTGGFVTQLSDGLIDGIVEGFEHDPTRATIVYFQQSGGAIARVGADATAFPNRYAMASLGVVTGWPHGSDPTPHMEYARRYWRELQPFSDGFYAVDVPPGTSTEGVNENYRENFPRLVQIKNRYDPTNLFRRNTNIQPTG